MNGQDIRMIELKYFKENYNDINIKNKVAELIVK